MTVAYTVAMCYTPAMYRTNFMLQLTIYGAVWALVYSQRVILLLDIS